MNNRGVGAEKVCRFVSTRLPRKLAMTKFFDCARNENPIRSALINEMCNFEDETRAATAASK